MEDERITIVLLPAPDEKLESPEYQQSLRDFADSLRADGYQPVGRHEDNGRCGWRFSRSLERWFWTGDCGIAPYHGISRCLAQGPVRAAELLIS